MIDCVFTGNFSSTYGGGTSSGKLANCMVRSNVAGMDGGGAFTGVLTDCTIVGNSAREGGGIASGILTNCVLSDSFATNFGGGAEYSGLFSCSVKSNSAGFYGGGAYDGSLQNCTITGNSAAGGGGVYQSTLTNCAIIGNRAGNGGGAYLANLKSCTVLANSASQCGGAYIGTATNTILYFNTGSFSNNYASCALGYCCTLPVPGSGIGNISVEPLLASSFRLSADSPCRGAGIPAYANGVDIDGEPWFNPPSIGCDEFHGAGLVGPLSVSVAARWTNVAVGFRLNLESEISGRALASVWDFGDGTVVSNKPFVNHTWTTEGDFTVVLSVFNESNPQGVRATLPVRVAAPAHYVSVGSIDPLPPYTSWETAASTIQDAVDSASVAGALVVVTNGVYETGGWAVHGTMTNRVAVTKPLVLRSVNGPSQTVIVGSQVPTTTNGDGAARCAYLASGATLDGFTLTKGATRAAGDPLYEQRGGAVFCESTEAALVNCIVIGNAARESAAVYSGTLNNCLILSNWAFFSGGGTSESFLNNSTVVGNWARNAGGVEGGAANNCIIYFNPSSSQTNYRFSSLNYCCTIPPTTSGTGNITNAPLFVDLDGGDLHLQPNSPCINAGNNAFAPGATDLDGNPRIVGGTVDIGAYEFRSPASQLSYAWLQQYGLPTDGSADFTDPDGHRANNWQEWQCATVPTNALSALRLLTPQTVGPNLVVNWESVTNKSYFLERSTSLDPNAFFLPLATNIAGQAGTTTFTDTNAAPAGPRFYRVGVE